MVKSIKGIVAPADASIAARRLEEATKRLDMLDVVPKDLLPRFSRLNMSYVDTLGQHIDGDSLDLSLSPAELRELTLHTRLECNRDYDVRECVYDQYGRLLQYIYLTPLMTAEALAAGETIHLTPCRQPNMQARRGL